MTETPPHLFRVLADSADPDSWHRFRGLTWTASDAKTWAKPDKVEQYAQNKFKPASTWGGNEATANGHRWEKIALEDHGIPQNTLFIHAPGEVRAASTVDGLKLETLQLAEVKTRHGKVPKGPTPAEVRQVLWQQFTLPEFESTEFIEVALDDDGKLVRYHVTTIPRDDAAIETFYQTFAVPIMAHGERIRAERAA